MCGIAGVCWHNGAEPASLADVEKMIAVLQHRGPDDDGIYDSGLGRLVDPRIEVPQSADSPGSGSILGHRRLSIIDLSGGKQPLSNEDGTVWIAFNGEIYNYRELQPRLESLGHRFRTSTDTEVIVHLYEQYGTDCVKHLRGMFAFAIWDDKKRQLFVARDRLGQKPLFYHQSGERLWFASELKALLQRSNAPRSLNAKAVDLFLTYQYVPHPYCILDGYHKLPPAHWALFSGGRLQIERYWTPPYETDSTVGAPNETSTRLVNLTADEWKSELRERLTESVRLRMRSDVPLGAFLSGGIDSTIIVGLMQQLSERPVHTFSIGFPVKQFDETSYAREAAEFLHTEHHESIVDPSALTILPKLIWQYDEPFADSSAIPTMYLSEMTRRDVKVALSGDGGDELFAGYRRYQAVRLGGYFDRLPRPMQALLTAKIWQRIPASVRQGSTRRRLKRLLAALGETPEHRYLKWVGIFDAERRSQIYTPEFAAQLNGFQSADFLLEAYSHSRSRDFVTQTTCTDVLTYLPCDILTKVDIASMTYGLECRSPFLDHHVAELAAQMPIGLKQKGRQSKKILIEAFADLLPPSIQRRSKMGFGVPLNHWFRNELRPLLHDALLQPSSIQRGFFNPKAIRQLVDDHDSGRWDHSHRLWALLCFEMWQRTFLDSSTAPTCPTAL